jgi:uncharacterized RDD family membrane protein YckC
MATVIDTMLVLIVAILLAYVLQGDSDTAFRYRLYVIVGFILLYEPICTSELCTVGQWVMGIRVRDRRNWGRISIPAAYVRISIKILLGFVSFLTIPIDSEKKGIHDIIVGSVVLLNGKVT